MDVIHNPFSPGAGSSPPELVGREDVLKRADALFARALAGRAEKSLILTGLRGAGKTVLLREMARKAVAAGYETVEAEAFAGGTLARILIPALRTALFALSRRAATGDKVRRAFAVLRSFADALTVNVGGVTVRLDIAPERGSADSGDLQVDLPQLFVAVANAAKERGRGIAILLDEIQYLTREELSALVMALHQIQQRSLPLVVVGAGLPVVPGLIGEAKSYAERLLGFPRVGPLDEQATSQAVAAPAEAAGAPFEASALEAIFNVTRGYPYFVQEWAYQSWNEAAHAPVTENDVAAAGTKAIERLDQEFFQVRLGRLGNAERAILDAMAILGEGPYPIASLAREMRRTTQALSKPRASLMAKGVIYSPARGELDFSVPMFGEFLNRSGVRKE
jgi:type II secretory pathway predicted ATPase ExeA